MRHIFSSHCLCWETSLGISFKHESGFKVVFHACRCHTLICCLRAMFNFLERCTNVHFCACTHTHSVSHTYRHPSWHTHKQTREHTHKHTHKHTDLHTGTCQGRVSEHCSIGFFLSGENASGLKSTPDALAPPHSFLANIGPTEDNFVNQKHDGLKIGLGT